MSSLLFALGPVVSSSPSCRARDMDRLDCGAGDPGGQREEAGEQLVHHSRDRIPTGARPARRQFPGTGGAQAQVVFSVPSHETLTGSTDRQAIESTVAQLKTLPEVVSVSDPFQTGTVSKDGRIAFAVVGYPVAASDVSTSAQKALLAAGAPAKAAGITVNFGGQVAQASTKSDTDLIGIVIAFVVLLIGFGSLLLGLLPLL